MPRGLQIGRDAGALILALLSFVSLARAQSTGATADTGCLSCHQGIEDMHPSAALSCVDCHGGNGSARTKAEAHVRAPVIRVEDERVLPLDKDLPWIQFRNPMDLRVTDRTCGTCHAQACSNLRSSLHGTTAGHLSDGYYEMGLLPSRGSRYSVMPTKAPPASSGERKEFVQPPPFQERSPRDQLSTHYADLARKECMQCHLWSQGRAVRGRVGFDGDYRGAGCAACHVPYSLDGLSRSADQSALRAEPGHPLRHEMTRAPTTQTCCACHYGDASIGLHFRGLSQLPPNAPGGPEVPGTTSEQLNRVFYLDDPAIVPPDVHHERGMHCIDCHTQSDVMGDGRLHGQMEYAVEISCTACHGTFAEISGLKTERGTPLEHLSWNGRDVVLRSKVDGREHLVPQAVHVLDPEHPSFNPAAARAMTAAHANVECYTCHAGWNVNLLGFHFSRQEQLTQLDLLTGKRTPGRVTTQEKVFATWKSFYVGRNERGALAPYLTGFSTMGSVWDEEGRLVLDQVMPVTAQGLSGMTMIHHQPHASRPTARSCVECHRTSTTWGMGSSNFRLARQLAFVADRRGIEVVIIDRTEFTQSVPLGKLALPGVVDLAVHVDPLQGHAHHVYAAEQERGIHVVDVRDPIHPRQVSFAACVNPLGLELVGDYLYVADGQAGLKVFEVNEPGNIRLVGSAPMFDARDVEVRWPWAYVADGPAGLAILDVRVPIAPTFLSQCDLGDPSWPKEAVRVESLFQYSRPVVRAGKPVDERTRARNLCAVLDRRTGLFLVDVTEPELPEVLYPRPGAEIPRGTERDLVFRDLALLSQVDLADPQGGERTAERDYAYLLSEQAAGVNRRSYITLIDVSDPTRQLPGGRNRILAGFATGQMVLADFYSAPTRRRIGFTPGERGVYVSDLSTSKEPAQVGALPGLVGSRAMAMEEFPLDRMIDEQGRPQKDVSHEGSRWLWLAEVERVLSVAKEDLGTDLQYRGNGNLALADVRARFSELDADRSCRLEGQELERAGAELDRDGDRRVTLLEFARMSSPGESRTSAAAVMESEAPVGTHDPDGELACLLDVVDPFRHDQDENNGLSRAEAERAFFDALDLDDDQALSLDELSRHPGELRSLRHRDGPARELFVRADKNRDGRVSQREFSLPDEAWNALDSDGDGLLRLVPPPPGERGLGHVLAGSEWPSRRARLVRLPPGVDVPRILAVFDRDANEALDQRELKERTDLFRHFDFNGDGKAERAEIGRLLGQLADEGVDSLPDDFLGRWDLDGSGVVEAAELPEGARLRLGLE